LAGEGGAKRRMRGRPAESTTGRASRATPPPPPPPPPAGGGGGGTPATPSPPTPLPQGERGEGRPVKSLLPLATVLACLIAFWYVAAALMNASLQRDAFANAGRADYSTADLVAASLNME